jgi:prepilin-type N-terminal cleavage/methylation domain-containing protein
MLLPSPAALLLAARRRAFTLVEMLAVMAVILILLVLAGPVVTALKNAGDVNKAVYDIAGILEQSRAYAMGSNTYVYVGFAEVNVTQPSSASPQAAGTGRVGIAVVATRDGTQGFNTSSLQSGGWSSAYPSLVNNLSVVGKLLFFDNLHIPDLGAPPTSGNMVRPDVSTETNAGVSYSLGNAQCVSATPFDYPLGAGLNQGQYSFKKVIQFDPQGVARLQTASNPSAITPYLEIGLQQTHGTAVPNLPVSPATGNIAALQIDGMTGVAHIYRP